MILSNQTYFESIRVFNRRVYNIAYHNTRYQKTMKDRFGIITNRNLRSLIDAKSLPKGLYKVRITYDENDFKVDYDPYSPRTIQSLKIVHTRDYDYTYKASDRSGLKSLYQQKGTCDDILIVKNRLVTDTFYTNVAFLQKGTWYTPKTPLLPGTMRQKLLDQGKIVKKDIPIGSIHNYNAVSLFNAMNPHKSCIVRLENDVIK